MSKIKIKEQNKGKFTSWAKAHGMTVQQAAKYVLRNKDKFSSTIIKRANFARNAAKWEDGGMTGDPNKAVTTVWNNNWRSMTDKNFFDEAIKPYNDTLAYNQFLNMPLADKEKLIPNDTFKVQQGKKGSTANRYGIQYFQNMPKYKGTNITRDGKTIMAEPSKAYLESVGLQHKFAEGGFMGALSAAGNILGPIGMGLNVLSSGIGLINNIKNNREAAAEAKRQRIAGVDQAQDDAQNAIVNPYAATFNTGGMFKGKLYSNKFNAGNSLVQDGEIILNPKGRVEVAKNPGAPIADNIAANFSTGTKIINRKDSAPLLKDVNKLNKTNKLEKDGVTNLTKNTLARNRNKYYSRLLDTYNAQEAKKKRKYSEAGEVPSPVPTWNVYNNLLGSTNDIDPNALAPAPNVTLGNKNTGVDWSKIGKVANTAGQFAPTLYNLGMGLFGNRDKLNYKDYANPYESNIRSLLADRRYDINAPLAANVASFNTTAANLRNLGGSRGQAMSNLTGAQNAKMFADMSEYERQIAMNNQYRGEEANMLYPLGRDTATTKLTIDDINQMTSAAGRNYLSSAASGIQNILLNRELRRNKQRRDRMLIDTIKSYSPYAKEWLPSLFSNDNEY